MKTSRSPQKTFWQKIVGLKKALIRLFVVSLCLQLLSLLSPLYMQMVVDEAISQLDVAGEANIMRVIRKLGITCVFIAHRPETIKFADHIIRL